MGNEFWAAIAGAVVSGIITIAMQFLALRAAKNERLASGEEQMGALARSALIKTGRIAANLVNLSNHLKQALVHSRGTRPWEAVQPVLNIPDRVNFSSDELGLVMSLRDKELLDLALNLETAHNDYVMMWREYSVDRRALIADLPPPERMDGMRGDPVLTAAQMALLRPRMAELDHLLHQIAGRLEQDAQGAKRALDLLNSALTKRFGPSWSLSLKGGNEDRPQA